MDNQTNCKVTEMILLAEDLPSPPGVALRLLDLYNQPAVEVDELAKVISIDPVLTAKIIAYCNSPMLARNHKTTSVENAIVTIGIRAVKLLALSCSLVQSNTVSTSKFDYDKFWARSLATAIVARTISQTMDCDGDDEFLIGLMLKIGQIGLAHTFPSRYAEMRKQSIDEGVSIFELEVAQWEANHLEVGADLLRAWDFPDFVFKGIHTYGNYLTEAKSNVAYKPGSILGQILVLTEKIVAMIFAPELLEEDLDFAKKIGNDWFGLSDDNFAQMFNESTEAWTSYAVLLNFDASESQTFEQLERRALKGIAQLSIGIHAENTMIAQENAELKINAMVDSLTGLKNRRAYDDEAPAEWDRSQRMDRPFILMMIDIDHFKQVNDVHGHGVGDRVLIAVGRALTGNARQYDNVYRFGGEEFVVVVPECSAENAFSTAERYRKCIEDIVVKLDTGELQVTASVGVAIKPAGESGTLDGLLSEADTLLYKAKKSGRNRVCCDTVVTT